MCELNAWQYWVNVSALCYVAFAAIMTFAMSLTIPSKEHQTIRTKILTALLLSFIGLFVWQFVIMAAIKSKLNSDGY